MTTAIGSMSMTSWISSTTSSGKPVLVNVYQDTEPWQEDAEMDQLVQSMRDSKFAMRSTQKRPGRNELCPCGSGRKFKKCHGC